ncbi:MAG TPA: Gfo/Idh/MocA family oxidoreductase [Candidatus Limnocylindrales bacterium]|nr:Gfo/Idh/MocA family oxidoreductase [Candidatus Limnocylindrales bacterium]
MTPDWQPVGESQLRIGLVGLGVMGRNHLRVLGAHPDVELVSVADPAPEALAAATEATGAAGYTDPLAMIAESELDAVVVAAPTTAHAAIALAALDRRIAVLMEKPIAATVDEALAILHASRLSGVPVAVGHVERFNPAVRELGRLLDDGWLSTVYSIVSRRAGPFPARIRDVGVAVDLATHDVDILSWIARERPVRAYAEIARRVATDHEDLMFGLLHFHSGAVGMLDVNWLTPTKRRQLVVVGEEGMFELDYLSQRLTYTESRDTTNPKLLGGYAPTFEGDVAVLPVTAAEPLAVELDDFVDVIRTGRRPTVDVVDGVWAVAMADALLSSARSGRPVDLSDLSSRFGS